VSVRARTTAAAVLVVGAALAIGAVALVAVMRDTLLDEVRTAARLRASEVAAAIEAGDDPSLAVAVDDEQLVQVVEDGRVVAASANVDGEPPVAPLRPGQSVTTTTPIDDDQFMVVAVAAGSATVLVAHAVDDVIESTEVVIGLLAIGLPVLLALVGAVTWWLTGRALAPVEAIRAEAEAVSATELHRRVPEQGGKDEIARLAATMNRMLGRLEDGQARQRRFVSDASHELRSPVAAIRQHAEVARAHPDRTTVPELADAVLTEDLRVERLVEDLLAAARTDEQGGGRSLREVDLDDLVFEEAARLRATTTLQIDTAGVSAGRVSGDAAALRGMLRNLGDNAAHHAAGRIDLSLRQEADGVVLTVGDDGPGVPEAERARVFERFVRLDAARSRDAGGAGLGLAIVAEVVAAHGGEVRILASPLGGALVEVRLPAVA